jgi:hypothetical protein
MGRAEAQAAITLLDAHVEYLHLATILTEDLSATGTALLRDASPTDWLESRPLVRALRAKLGG